MSLGFSRSSIDDMEDNDVDEAECVGVSVGDAAAVDGAESATVDVTVLRRRDLSDLAVVEAMLNEVDGLTKDQGRGLLQIRESNFSSSCVPRQRVLRWSQIFVVSGSLLGDKEFEVGMFFRQ